MNFFAALTCTIFAWGLAEGSKVFFEKFSECRSHLPTAHTEHGFVGGGNIPHNTLNNIF